ncbi:uncharacterized protein LOC144108371 [Amblyomma americanum]
MEPDAFQSASDNFLKSLSLSATNIEDLQRAMSKQSGSTVWKQERRKRLTPSLFGAICKMKPTTGCLRTVGDILYKEITSEAIRYGKDHECLALKQIENECNVVVKECGLFVDQESPFLGASPDGLIGEDVLVEVKCSYSARDLTPLEGVRAKKITCCEENKNGRLQLQTNSNYWYQVQGQLNIARRRKCLFVLRTKKGISTEVISRNQSFWEDEMLPRLKKFYMHCLLPELVDPRRRRGLPISEPDYILEAQNTRSLKRPLKETSKNDDNQETTKDTHCDYSAYFPSFSVSCVTHTNCVHCGANASHRALQYKCRRTTTVFHPQMSGLTQRLNKTTADMLAMVADAEPGMSSFRTSCSSTTPQLRSPVMYDTF